MRETDAVELVLRYARMACFLERWRGEAMFVEYVQFLTEDGGISSQLLDGPLPWIALGVIVLAVLWTLKK